MNITDFAESRGQQSQTISRYMGRHPELFDGHTTKIGKSVELDDEALKILDEVYPLPKPITVIQGVPEEEHLRTIVAKDEEIHRLQLRIIETQEKLNTLTLECGELKAKSLLLEDKEQRIEELKEELETEKSKTWLQKLLGK